MFTELTINSNLYLNFPSTHPSRGFPGDSVVKNLPANEEGSVSIPGSGRSPREGNGKPLQYFYFDNPMNRRGHDLATEIKHQLTGISAPRAQGLGVFIVISPVLITMPSV